MANSNPLIERFRLVQDVGNEIVNLFDNDQLLTDAVCLIGAKLRYMGVRISLIEQEEHVTWAWTGDYGQTQRMKRESVEMASGVTGDDIMEWAVEQGVLSPEELPGQHEFPHIDDPQSAIDVPIKQENQVTGTLSVESREADAFDEQDQYILEFLASQISIALAKARLLNLERRKTEYLSLVNDVGRKSSGVLTVPELCDLVTQLIHQHFAYSVVSLFLIDPVRPVLVLHALAGEYRDHAPQGYEQSNEQGILGHVVQTNKPFMTNDVQHDPHYYQPIPEMNATRAELCVPLRSGDRVTGIIDVQNTHEERPFDEVDMLAMTALAGQVAITLDNAHLFQDLKNSVTEQTQLQEQLIQSEKLSAIGQMLGGVIHELNNPLTSVIGFSDLALLREQDTRTGEDLKRISQEARRMSQIVKNLLAFARKEKPVRELVNLNALINDVVRIRAYNLRVTNVQVIEEYESALPFTICDPNQLRQVFLNILTNAEQAIRKMHSRGWITITTSSEMIDEEQYIQIAIKDSGPGIPDSLLSKIFDPFVTTKKSDEGTGLGLSISYGLIQDQGGRIRVESPLHEGACFIIELPVRNQPSDISPSSTEPEFNATLPVKRILVVDDEDDIVDYLARALKMRGHVVDTAHDGESAWEKIKQQQYDVIISDLKMPGLTGHRLYDKLRTHEPHLLEGMILMTGDVISPDAQRFLNSVDVPYLEKPFTFKQLETIIASIFNEQP